MLSSICQTALPRTLNKAAWAVATPCGAGAVFTLRVLLALGPSCWHAAGEPTTCRRQRAGTEPGMAAGACWAPETPCLLGVPPWCITGDVQGEGTQTCHIFHLQPPASLCSGEGQQPVAAPDAGSSPPAPPSLQPTHTPLTGHKPPGALSALKLKDFSNLQGARSEAPSRQDTNKIRN